MATYIDEHKYKQSYDSRSHNDFKVEWYSGSGKGGQNRNKHQNCCRITHTPTGICKTAQTRDRVSSERLARKAIEEELDQRKKSEIRDSRSDTINSQFGSGQRGDKIRTYRFQDNITTDHRNGKRGPTDQILKGKFELLWS